MKHVIDWLGLRLSCSWNCWCPVMEKFLALVVIIGNLILWRSIFMFQQVCFVHSCPFSDFLSNWTSRWWSGWAPVWRRTRTVTLLQYLVITLNISVLWKRDITMQMIQRWRVTVALLSKLILWVFVSTRWWNLLKSHHLHYSVSHSGSISINMCLCINIFV